MLWIAQCSNPRRCLSSQDYSLNVTEHMSHDNILFEVVDVNQEIEGYRLDALSLHLFENSIPPGRQTGRKTIAVRSTRPTLSLRAMLWPRVRPQPPPNPFDGNGSYAWQATFSVYELSLTSWDVKEGMYYLSVKCGSQGTTYKINAREIKGYYATEGESIEGQLCKGSWMYHGVDVTAEAVRDT